MENLTDTKQHETTPHQLTQPQMRAIVMRAEGATYQDVSDVLGVSVNTLKNWFRPNSKMRHLYDEYCFQVTTQVSQDALNRLELLMEDAVNEVQRILVSPHSSDQNKLRAATLVINKVSPMTLEKVALMGQAKAVEVELESGLRHEEVVKSSENITRYSDAYKKVMLE